MERWTSGWKMIAVFVLYRFLSWQKETIEAMRDPGAVIDFILENAEGQERLARKKRRKK
jgi:hypothetical protein